jgi:hypothetical protein
MITQDDIDAMRPQLVGIAGKAGSGKSTAAQVLIDAGWTRVKMAGPFKDMLRAMGLTERHIEGDLKEVPCDLLQGQTPRHAMITLGTEWGRDIIGPNLWIDLASRRIKDALDAGCSVVVDDIRFDNEADVIRNLGGCTVRIDRASGVAVDHKSEAGVSADIEYKNNGSVSELRGYFDYVFLKSGEWDV